MNYLDLPLSEIHAALLAKEITPLDLAKESLSRAKANRDNAFEMLLEEEALEEASKLVEPEADNLLWGIPYVLKDNYSTKGLETTASSNVLNGYVPLFDATIVTKLKEKHCVLIGKATMDELAMGGTGTTGHKGITYNPYDPSHTRLMGGSSCGSAVSCADGIVPFAIGSDTGDSVRKPASYGALVGMKPTWGRISRYGLFPFAPSLDHVAYFTRYVEDAAIVLSALAGHDDLDQTSSFREMEDYRSFVKNGIQGKKIAVIPEVFDSLRDERLKKAFCASCEALKRSGASVEFVSMDKTLLESLYATYFVLSCAEATSNDANLDGIKFGPYYGGKTYQEVMSNARTKGFSELIKRRFVIGSFCLMSENQEELFLRAQKNRAKIVEAVNAILENHDFIFLPAAPSVPGKIGASSDKLSDEYLIADNHLCLGNFAGLPSITVPLCFEDGLPIGANLMGRAFEEGPLFAAAKALEDATGLAGVSTKNRKEGTL